MRLISCHVVNFGKLHNYQHSFTSGLNVILHDNGWGKSTLLTFIKAMFYGLPKSRKTDLDDNQRKKYQPWQGGNYGGKLVFEVEGKQYRIERFFVDAKGKDETFELYDVATGRITNSYASNIGEQLFGVDADAFDKSACLGQRAIDISATNSINARLTALVENTSCDVKDFEVADGILAKAIKQYKDGHSKGLLSNLQDQLSELAYEINGNCASIEQIETLQSQQQQLEDSLVSDMQLLQSVRARLKDSNKQATVKHYLDKKQELSRLSSQHQQLSNAYPNFANEQYFVENIDKAIDNARALSSQQAMFDTVSNGTNSHTVIDSEQFLAEVDGHIQQAVQLDQGNRALASNSGIGLDPSLCTQHNISTADQYIDVLSNNAGRRVHSNRSWVSIVLTILAIVTVVGIPVLIYMHSKQRRQCTAQGNDVSTQVAQFLVGFGVQVAEAEQLQALYQLKANMLTGLEQQGQRNNIAQSCRAIADSLDAFCTRHNIVVEGDYYTSLVTAKTTVIAQCNVDTQLQHIRNQCNTLDNQLIAFCNECRIAVGNKHYHTMLSTAKADIMHRIELSTDIATKKVDLDQFVATNNIDSASIHELDNDIDVTALEHQEVQLSQSIDRLKDDIDNKKQQISLKTESYNLLQDLTMEQKRLNTELAVANTQHDNLVRARAMLFAAKDSLASAYLAPMKSAFAKYYQLLEGRDISFDMNTDLELRIVEGDMDRELKYFSAGTRDAITLSMRFALIETLFCNSQPMVLLDDPFVNLDDDRLDRAIQFVNTVSQDMQMLYFTCNTART